MSKLPTTQVVLTEEEFREALPAQFKKSVNKALINKINTTLSHPEEMEYYRDHLVSYTHVLKEGKYKLSTYIDAVRYVSFKMMGLSNKDAYVKTFPDKYEAMVLKGTAEKDIASYIHIYNKGKLVNSIMEQTMIPTHILNQDLYQKAINVQAELMMSARSEKVRSDAANSLMNQLRPPEIKKVELDIAVAEDSAIAELRKTTQDLVIQQKRMLASGMMGAQDIAHSKIISDVEYEQC